VDKQNSRVAAAIAAAGIEPCIRILDADAKSAVAAAEQLGCEVGAIANSLVFECDGEPLLVMSSGAHRVDTELLARALGATAINKAAPKFVRSATDQVIGDSHPRGTRRDCARSSTKRWHGIGHLDRGRHARLRHATDLRAAAGRYGGRSSTGSLNTLIRWILGDRAMSKLQTTIYYAHVI
jgi:hypothetical protein